MRRCGRGTRFGCVRRDDLLGTAWPSPARGRTRPGARATTSSRSATRSSASSAHRTARRHDRQEHSPVTDTARPSAARVAQLVVSCVVLGVGVALLLCAALGSDGYSTFVNGLSLSLDVPFALVNCVLGVVLVAMAWLRGLTPGVGTVVQPVVVGVVVQVVLDALPDVHAIAPRIALLASRSSIVARRGRRLPRQRDREPARPRPRRSRGTRRCRSAGATPSCRPAARSAAGRSAPQSGRARSSSSCCSARPSTCVARVVPAIGRPAARRT